MKGKVYDAIIRIGACLVSGDVVQEYFCCDYKNCKGCCCVIGDSGAPLREEELEGLEQNFERYCSLMNNEGLQAIREKGFFDVDIEGELVTPLCKDTEACAYAAFEEDGACYCTIERAGCVKPISCSLYPIRITKLRSGDDALNLHRWHICKAAFEKGKRKKIRVYQFLREPLERLYGKNFFAALDAAAKHLNTD